MAKKITITTAAQTMLRHASGKGAARFAHAAAIASINFPEFADHFGAICHAFSRVAELSVNSAANKMSDTAFLGLVLKSDRALVGKYNEAVDAALAAYMAS